MPGKKKLPPLELTKEDLAAIRADTQSLPKFLKIEQVAELLQIPLSTIESWSSQGRLDGCKRRLGGNVRFVRVVLLRLVLNGELQ